MRKLLFLTILVIIGCGKGDEILIKEFTNPFCANIDNPAPGDSIPLDDHVHIVASACSDYGILRVDFFYDDGLIGSDPEMPYEMYWHCAAIGKHYVSITVLDNENNTASDRVAFFVY